MDSEAKPTPQGNVGRILAITLGDPSGIGPEVALRAVALPDVRESARFLLLGPGAVAEGVHARLRMKLKLKRVERAGEVRGLAPGVVGVLSTGAEPASAFPVGKLAAISGHAAVRAVKMATRLALDGDVDAIVTAPLSKEAMHLAGYRYPGHTEILGEMCGRRATMLLVSPRLRVIHVSVHCSLEEAIRRVTRANVRTSIQTAAEAGRQLGIASPRVAVCGLNPHAGEGGLFGSQDEREIRPAVEDARAVGTDATGPWPADTVFMRAANGEFDLVVAMYHDQGHIPVKLFGLEGGVNVTLGLPIIRTSVDHGTAFDLAGRGVAQADSMVEAIRTALAMCQARDEARSSAQSSSSPPPPNGLLR